MKSIAINMPKSSPATLVNLVMMVQALNIARRKSRKAVQTHTLFILVLDYIVANFLLSIKS